MILPDCVTTENVCCLPRKPWKIATAEIMDMALPTNKDDWFAEGCKALEFVSIETGRGSLSPAWLNAMKTGNSLLPCACLYKLLTCKSKHWGMQRLLEEKVPKQ